MSGFKALISIFALSICLSPLYASTIQSKIVHRTFIGVTELAAEYTQLHNALLSDAVSSFLTTMTLEEKAAQLFHVSFPNEEYLYSHTDVPPVGGFLFFGFNIPDSAETLIKQNKSIKNFYSETHKIPPFFSLDCEGGDVNRLRSIAGRIPSAKRISQIFTPSEALAYYDAVATMIAATGFDVNLAPVIESENESNIRFLGERSYGTTADVLSYSGSFIKALIKNDVYPVVKHYPGNTEADPHLGLPVLDVSREEYESVYIQNFSALLSQYRTGVLAAHTVVPEIADMPVCLSKQHLSYLRSFVSPASDILVFSDDLLMQALTNNGYLPEQSIVEAVKSGVDILMLAISRWEPYLRYLIDACEDNPVLVNRIEESCYRIIRWKCEQGILSLTPVYDDGIFSLSVTIPASKSESELSGDCTLSTERFYMAKRCADSILKGTY